MALQVKTGQHKSPDKGGYLLVLGSYLSIPKWDNTYVQHIYIYIYYEFNECLRKRDPN